MAQARKADLVTSVRFYIDKLLADASLSGMKVLLLDPDTTRIVSMVYSQTQILEKEVYLVEILGKSHEAMSHLKAAVFVRPTEDNFALLSRELADPKFKEYHLFFTNVVPQDLLSRLARQDEHELIMQVQEFFADFMVVNRDLFHLGITDSLRLSSNLNRTLESGLVFERNVSGLCSTLLALKKIPGQIRYQQSSEVARRMANDVLTTLGKGEPFDFPRSDSTVLLILDRRDDPITPLLTQWTYQAMVHELLGLFYNRVSLARAPNVAEDMKEVVLSVTQDDFFAKNCHSNFGELGTSVKQLLDEYQRHTKRNENITSIEDMQAFLERFPDFRAKSINISKHVAVIGELSRIVDVCKLLDISELEQEISCSTDHSGHKNELLARIRNPMVKSADKLRLAMLFLLKYESYDETRELKAVLSERNAVSADQLALLDAILEYAGESRRTSGILFSGQGILSKITKSLSGVEGVQNVYTQHQPLLVSTLQSLAAGKMRDALFPPMVVPGASGTGARPTEVVVFFVGGTTYEEAARVAEFNASNAGMRVILGGSTIHNSKSFLDEIRAVFVK